MSEPVLTCFLLTQIGFSVHQGRLSLSGRRNPVRFVDLQANLERQRRLLLHVDKGKQITLLIVFLNMEQTRPLFIFFIFTMQGQI